MPPPPPDAQVPGPQHACDGEELPQNDPVWVPVGPAEAVPPGGVLAVDLDGTELVVWRGEDGTLCASDARCPHAWTHLGVQGAVSGCELVCLTHFWHFDRAGRGTTVDRRTGAREARADLPMHPCAERDGQIVVAQRDNGR